MRMVLRNKRGFTLIEIIVSLIAFSIFAAMAIPYLGSLLTGTVRVSNRLDSTTGLYRTMENIIQDYRIDRNLDRIRMLVSSSPYDHQLRDASNPSQYGTDGTTPYYYFRVVWNHFVTFPAAGGAEVNCADPCTAADRRLKITIQDLSTGATITTLFSYY
jgi:prepilin-type N-terminal cleavage/methylation domain-containing protein